MIVVSRKKTGSDSLSAITTHTIFFVFCFICVLGVVVKLGKVLVLIQRQRKAIRNQIAGTGYHKVTKRQLCLS